MCCAPVGSFTSAMVSGASGAQWRSRLLQAVKGLLLLPNQPAVVLLCLAKSIDAFECVHGDHGRGSTRAPEALMRSNLRTHWCMFSGLCHGKVAVGCGRAVYASRRVPAHVQRDEVLLSTLLLQGWHLTSQWSRVCMKFITRRLPAMLI